LFATKRAVAPIGLGRDGLDPKLDCSTKTTALHYALVNVAVNAQLSIARFMDIVFDSLCWTDWQSSSGKICPSRVDSAKHRQCRAREASSSEGLPVDAFSDKMDNENRIRSIQS